MTWTKETSCGNESAKIRWEVVRYTRGKGLDIGCGPAKQFPHWIGVDNRKDTALFGVQMNPDVVIETAENLSLFASHSMDFVFSSHLLEHIEPEKVPKTLAEWTRVIKQNGYLVLYLPDKSLYPNIGEPGGNPDHKWDPDYASVVEAMSKIGKGWDLVDYQLRDQGNEYSGLYVFKLTHKGRHFGWKDPKPTKRAAVVRYGAIGDLIQASSVFAGLKKQGFHVTVYASSLNAEVIEHDPNVDDLYLQDVDQVPNPYLGEFFAHEKKKYERWVNLCESVEGSFLVIANGTGRTIHGWPAALRHELLNKNYLEVQHQIAQVPHEPKVKFYATADEKDWARRQRSRMGDFVISWCLAGSSVHKRWHGLDPIIARTLVDFPNVDFVLQGGPDAVMLESGWENERRVHRTSGKWSKREGLAFLEHADLVMGPETGLLNAAAQMKTPKVVFLSHSTHENLTRDWTNVHPIWSGNTVCPGRGNNEAPACHQLHYSWEHCKQADDHKGERTGIAQCMFDMDIGEVYKVLWHCIKWAMEAKAA